MKKLFSLMLMTILGVSIVTQLTQPSERSEEHYHVESFINKRAEQRTTAQIDLHVEGKHFVTYPIKYEWTSHQDGDTFKLIFLDDDNSVIATFPDLVEPTYTLVPDTDGEIENEFIGLFYDVRDRYGILVEGYAEGSTVPTYYSDVVHYDRPNAYYSRTYGSHHYRSDFAEQYFFEERVQSHDKYYREGHELNDELYQTRRLRTATIDKNYVVMSPRRVGAGLAYIEYEFDYGIETFEIDLGLWSGSEYLRASDCTALVEYKSARTGEWITLLDLLNDVQLPVGKDNLKTFTLNIPKLASDGQYEDAATIRVISSAPAIGSSKNTGRLVIGDISLYQGY